MNNDINEIIFVISMLLSDLHEFSDVGILVYWIFFKTHGRAYFYFIKKYDNLNS